MPNKKKWVISRSDAITKVSKTMQIPCIGRERGKTRAMHNSYSDVLDGRGRRDGGLSTQESTAHNSAP